MPIGHMPVTQYLNLALPSPIELFRPDWPGAENVSIHIKRDDKIHSIISGNKWRKLQGVFTSQDPLPQHIVSFGGAYSNHLHALAYCCAQLSIPLTAIVRGYAEQALSPTLKDLIRWNADIRFVDRMEYRRREDADYLTYLAQQYPQALIIPEGGSQQQALTGMAQLLDEVKAQCQYQFNYLVTPVASGATMAGLVQYSSPQQTIVGIAMLKGDGYLESLVTRLLPNVHSNNWHINHEYHHGGYAKITAELQEFCSEIKQKYRIPVEPVYSGKVFYALKALLATGYFRANSRILILHTGGLQGQRTK
jgi:1-aminocyclopropane-1-carboxylate deaminase